LGVFCASGGGGVGPAGGVVGQLPQYYVSYDLSELETLNTPSSGMSLLDNLNHIRYEINVAQTPDRYVQMTVVNYMDDIYTGDGIGYIVIPPIIDGMDLIYVHAKVIASGTTGTTDIQIANVTNSVDILSTKLTIDSGETGSEDATPAVIDITKDDVVTNDLLRIDVDAVSSVPPKGLIVTLGFKKP